MVLILDCLCHAVVRRNTLAISKLESLVLFKATRNNELIPALGGEGQPPWMWVSLCTYEASRSIIGWLHSL
jgi:hypothetical protein